MILIRLILEIEFASELPTRLFQKQTDALPLTPYPQSHNFCAFPVSDLVSLVKVKKFASMFSFITDFVGFCVF